jgi:hypothetical protein
LSTDSNSLAADYQSNQLSTVQEVNNQDLLFRKKLHFKYVQRPGYTDFEAQKQEK